MIDLEESTDKETIHLLIHLLMQFMSRPDLAFPTDEKPTCRLMAIVLKHVYLLMGFNNNEKMFQFSSGRIRCSSVYNGFMANLPQFLDQNHEMGATDSLFNFIIQLLIYSPYPNNSIPATFDVMQNTTYSLWFLEIQVRRNWLMALLVIFYKFNLSLIPEPFLTSLIRIVMNSLESQFHQCRRIPTTIIIPDARLPFGTESDDRDQGSQSQMKPPSQLRKLHDSSIECDETESELVAIPESDLSDSTLQGSIDGGMSDDLAPLKSDVKKKKSDYEESKKAPKVMPKSQSVDTTKSLSEGVRMMFSSAILSPPVNVQKAIVVTQSSSIRPFQSTSKDTCAGVCTSQMVANVANNQFRTVSAVVGEKQRAIVAPQNGNGSCARRSNSPVPRALGRQKRIIDTNGIQQPSTSSLDDKKTPSGYIRNIDRRHNYFGSPESPLSKMDIMSPPETDLSTDGTENLLSPSSVKLEFPTPERLLPIGNMSKENVSSLVDRVREALSIPDISHLKSQDHLDKSLETSPPNSSRAMSPRKLIKQIALIESPPSVNAAEVAQTTVKKSDPKNALNAREEKRQTFQKVGPYQSTDGRLKYAGSWAPQSHNDDDYDEDDEGSIRASYVSIDVKPVKFVLLIILSIF